MTCVLGVDGGGSKTFALVSDGAGRLLGFGRSNGSNHLEVGMPKALEEIERAAREAVEEAGVEAGEIEVASYGLSGADLPHEFDLLRPRLERLGLGRRVELRNDTQAALRSGTRRSWGVVLVCGSAFNAAGRAPDGTELTFPAQGWISGDRVGGEAIAQEMVRLVMRHHDGRGPETMLTGLVLDALGEPSPHDLMLALYHKRIAKRDILNLVPLLFAAALRGDEPAQDLIVRTGEELGVSAAAVIRGLGVEKLPVEVVLAGGVFKGEGPLLTDTIRQVVHRTAPAATLVRTAFEPVVGSVLLGLEAAGVRIDEEVYSNLRATTPASLRGPNGRATGERATVR